MSKDLKEAEANYFAMLLLMPDELLAKAIQKLGGIDVADDKKITKLAKQFEVPLVTMSLRLGIYFKENNRL